MRNNGIQRARIDAACRSVSTACGPEENGGWWKSYDATNPRPPKVDNRPNSGPQGDDDNVWHDDHLPSALAALDAGAEVVYSGVQLVDVNNAVVGDVCTPFDLSALRHRNYVDASTIVARRSPAVLFSRLPRRRGGARQEDWELAYRMAKRRPLAFTGVVSVTYLLNPESRYTTH